MSRHAVIDLVYEDITHTVKLPVPVERNDLDQTIRRMLRLNEDEQFTLHEQVGTSDAQKLITIALGAVEDGGTYHVQVYSLIPCPKPNLFRPFLWIKRNTLLATTLAGLGTFGLGWAGWYFLNLKA